MVEPQDWKLKVLGSFAAGSTRSFSVKFSFCKILTYVSSSCFTHFSRARVLFWLTYFSIAKLLHSCARLFRVLAPFFAHHFVVTCLSVHFCLLAVFIKLEDVDVLVADHVSRVHKTNFLASWEEIGDEFEMQDTYALTQMSSLEGNAIKVFLRISPTS